MGQLGDLLREAREAKGLSLSQAEKDTKIRQRLIRALEEENYASLPERIYTKGLLKNYAHYLGLDVSEVMRLFGEEEVAPVSAPPLSQSLGSPPLFSPDFIALIILIVALGLVAFWGIRQYVAPLLLVAPTETPTPSPSPTSTSVVAPSPTFSPLPSPTPTEVIISGLLVEIEVVSRTWLEVTVDGQEVYGGLIEAGETQAWPVEEAIALHVGNAAGLQVTINGQPQPPLGEVGQVVDKEWRVEDFITPTPGPSPSPATPTVTETIVPPPTQAP